ncbi:Tail fiber assembly domain-containing protein [Pseudomonas amygdali pv. morsprunorum]|nr:Tail fiber assembly domain-containing protein [Pseudomonas amygdali pv. morsprunorum]
MSSNATYRIHSLLDELDILQDAIAMNLATEEQLKSVPAINAELYAFRLYRVRLSLIDTLPGYPRKFDWPVAPAQPFVYVPPSE